MKKESDLWKLLKKNTPEIKWTRVESWASPGVPDLYWLSRFMRIIYG